MELSGDVTVSETANPFYQLVVISPVSFKVPDLVNQKFSLFCSIIKKIKPPLDAGSKINALVIMPTLGR